MRFIKHVLNPYHSSEEKLKKARDIQIKKLSDEGKTDEEIIDSLMNYKPTLEFIEEYKHLGRGHLLIKLRKAYTESVTNARNK